MYSMPNLHKPESFELPPPIFVSEFPKTTNEMSNFNPPMLVKQERYLEKIKEQS